MMHVVAAVMIATLAAQPRDVNPKAVSMVDFQKRLEGYLALRESLAKKLEPLSPTASASELQTRQQALAKALQTARAGARQGDLIPAPVQEQIRATVHADMKRRTPATQRAALEEVPDGPLPGINKIFPEQAALATVPPLLLASLPRLPDNLQYRFFGRHVVILDGDTEIIVDYVPNALPR
jgi:hypothetical protein